MDRRAFIGSVGPRAHSRYPAPASAQPGAQGRSHRHRRLSPERPPRWAGPSPARPSVKALLRGLRELGYVVWARFRDRGSRRRRPAGALARPGRRARPSQGGRDRRPQSKSGNAQAGHLDDPHRHGGGLRPCGRWIHPEPRTPGRELHGAEPSGDRHDGKRLELLKELVPSAAPVAVLWNNWRPDEHPLLAGRRNRGQQARVEAAEARDSQGGRARGSVQGGDRRARERSAHASRPGSSLAAPGSVAELAAAKPTPGQCTTWPSTSRPAG